jgi:hypothetical protein
MCASVCGNDLDYIYIFTAIIKTHTESKRCEVKIIRGMIDIITKKMHICKINTSACLIAGVLCDHAV